jgi:hypothetical protein
MSGDGANWRGDQLRLVAASHSQFARRRPSPATAMPRPDFARHIKRHCCLLMGNTKRASLSNRLKRKILLSHGASSDIPGDAGSRPSSYAFGGRMPSTTKTGVEVPRAASPFLSWWLRVSGQSSANCTPDVWCGLVSTMRSVFRIFPRTKFYSVQTACGPNAIACVVIES